VFLNGKKMKTLFALCKIRISLLSTLSFAAGWTLASGSLSPASMVLIAGTLFLACGASALNQVQERRTDALMERTRLRPIPAGKISKDSALLFAWVLVFSGLLMLSFSMNPWVPGLGLFALIWYNGIYTPMKKKSRWASIPGALVGSIPPVMGWAAAGGRILDPQIMAVAFFMFLWQVPHFWLLVLNHPRDYERAGLPTIATIFTHEQLQRVTFVWIFSVAVASLLIPLYTIQLSFLLYAALFSSAVLLVWTAAAMFRKTGGFRRPFRVINLYALSVMVLLSADKLWEHF
jgi:protoheme IX farnesyltransferase